ncbi:hypothetical protein ACFLTD_01885 [Elusimicrobiota bacterium]
MIKKLFIAGIIGVLFISEIVYSDSLRDEYRREIRESRIRERNQTRITSEVKTEDMETGKSLIDVHGNRVRVEKYFSRPAPNQINTTVLNTREDIGKIDQRDWLGTFNKDLPVNLRGIAYTMYGSRRRKLGKPEYYLTNVRNIDSSGDNYIKATYDGGWLWKWLNVGGGYYLVVFDNEKVMINGKDKIEHIRKFHDQDNNIAGLFERHYPDANGVLKPWLPGDPNGVRPDATIEIDGDEWYRREKLAFRDGTSLTRSRYLIDDEGDILERGIPSRKGNFEVVFEASEFGEGNTIDIVITPGPAEEVSLEIE